VNVSIDLVRTGDQASQDLWPNVVGRVVLEVTELCHLIAADRPPKHPVKQLLLQRFYNALHRRLAGNPGSRQPSTLAPRPP
jgi:hypothetical protein